MYFYPKWLWQGSGRANREESDRTGRVDAQQVVPMKMEPIEGSETSAFRPQTPGNYPKENILHKEHGESLKSRMMKDDGLSPLCKVANGLDV